MRWSKSRGRAIRGGLIGPKLRFGQVDERKATGWVTKLVSAADLPDIRFRLSIYSLGDVGIST